MTRLKKYISFIILVAMVFTLSACKNPAENKKNVAETKKIKITDIKGRQIELEKLPERIVSLSPSNTEIVFALGAGNKLVGVTSYCDYPEEVKDVEKIGTFEGPNIEMIKKVQPDVVLAGGYIQEDIITALENLNIPVVSTEASGFDTIYDSIALIGKLVGGEDKAEEIINNMHKTVDDIESKVRGKEKLNVFYLVWAENLTTAGKGTFINDVIKIAGANNIAESVEGWAKYSAEELVKQNPDMIISAYHSTNEGMSKEDLMRNPLLKNLDCVKKGNIYVMKDDNIISRSGPRIVDAAIEMAKALHGDIF